MRRRIGPFVVPYNAPVHPRVLSIPRVTGEYPRIGLKERARREMVSAGEAQSEALANAPEGSQTIGWLSRRRLREDGFYA